MVITLGELVGTESSFWDAGNVLFLDLGAGYINMFSLRKPTELYARDMCTMVHVCQELPVRFLVVSPVFMTDLSPNLDVSGLLVPTLDDLWRPFHGQTLKTQEWRSHRPCLQRMVCDDTRNK